MHEPATRWRRNLFAVTAAGFIGYTGFTLVMPFLPLYIGQLGVTNVAEIAMWTGISLGVTPGLTALMSPFWGRLADRYGRKVMVERSLGSFVLVMAATAFVTHPWHVFALRVVQGLFAGYGVLTLTMAADSVSRERMPAAIGLVQTAQRLGPAVGPVIGGGLVSLVGLRRGFLVTALVYLSGLLLVAWLYDEGATRGEAGEHATAVPFAEILALPNFGLLMTVIFLMQFVDRSFAPVLPLYVEQVGWPRTSVPLVAGSLFSVTACTGALGHHFCSPLLKRFDARRVVAGGLLVGAVGALLLAASGRLWVLGVATALLGVGIGIAMTAAFSVAGALIPPGVHGAGFGVLSSAALVGMAVSPVFAGLVSGHSIRTVFLADVAFMLGLAGLVSARMAPGGLMPALAGGAAAAEGA